MFRHPLVEFIALLLLAGTQVELGAAVRQRRDGRHGLAGRPLGPLDQRADGADGRPVRARLAHFAEHDVFEDQLAKPIGRRRLRQSAVVVDAEDGFEQRDLRRKVFAQICFWMENGDDDGLTRLARFYANRKIGHAVPPPTARIDQAPGRRTTAAGSASKPRQQRRASKIAFLAPRRSLRSAESLQAAPVPCRHVSIPLAITLVSSRMNRPSRTTPASAIGRAKNCSRWTRILSLRWSARLPLAKSGGPTASARCARL